VVSILLLFCCFALGDDFLIAEHLNTKSPYWTNYNNGTNQTAVPQGCDATPIHFNYLARHGSRAPTTGDIKSFVQLQKNLRQYGQYITNSNYTWMKTWTNPYIPATQGTLTNQGEEEHYNTSQRYKDRFAPLFGSKYQSKKYPIQTTQVERTARSANAFGYGLFEGTGHLGPQKYEAFFTYSDSQDEDIILRFFDNCPNYETDIDNNAETDVESQKWLSYHLPQLTNRIQTLLFGGLNPGWNLTGADVMVFYKACSFDISTFMDEKFCNLFEPEDILMFEYYNDLSDYYVKGYGTYLAYQISCPLLRDFIDKTDSVIANPTTDLPQYAYMRFAHAETVLPFAAILGLFRDDSPLKADWNSTQINGRKWRTSDISPFAANVAFVLYNCSSNPEKYRVKLIHNENEVQIPGCSDMYCPWNQVKTIYQNSVNTCDFDSICGIKNETVICPPMEPPHCSNSHAGEAALIITLIFIAAVFIVGGVVGYKRWQKRSHYHRLSTLSD
jgi:multiple inositol-polyphosphate phosphatase/2,3-bisphosphoglycerate 3-phosphatase